MTSPVLLVNMPWAEYFRPSLALGLIQALLLRHGIACRTLYANIDYAEIVGPRLYRSTEDLYRPHLEWVFSEAAFGPDCSDEEVFYSELRDQRAGPDRVAALRALRAEVSRFLDRAMEAVGGEVRVVGFTTSMLQTVPAAALAGRIKRERPDLPIVFGGANCRGVTGRALIRAFPSIDVVVAEQCDAWVGELFDRLLSHRPLDDLHGILWRRGNEIVVNSPGPRFDDLDQNPLPDYSDFFDRMDRSPLRGREQPSVPFEGSRGCWWGQRNHCRFCGLNGTNLAFRVRDPARVVSELAEQRRRYGVDVFIASDEILPLAYLDELPDRLRSELPGVSLFWEMKPTVRRAQLAALASACRLGTQPGLEHLSTRLLGLMCKGTSGATNVTMLRRALELDVNLWWNLLFDVPGESVDDYLGLVRRFWSLYHLQPPFVFPITLTRYSPYHEEPERHGIRITGPQRGLEHAYRVAPDLLQDLALTFDFVHESGYDALPVAALLHEAVARWEERHRFAELRVRLEPMGAVVSDGRRMRPLRYRLDAPTTVAYRHLESPHTLVGLRSVLLQTDASAYLRLGGEAGLRAALFDFERKGLAWRDGDRFVALAVPEHPRFWLEREDQTLRTAPSRS